MKKAVITLSACVALSCIFGMTSQPLQASAAQSSDFACQYSERTDPDANYAAYGGKTTVLTAEQAAAQNIPEGYENEVLVVEGLGGSYSRGVMLDFSSSAIAVNMVEAITFRVYVGSDGAADGYPEVRIVQPGSGANGWIMRYYLSTKGEEDQWTEITLDANGTNFASGNTLTSLAKDGILDKFELSVRVKAANVPFYVDSVSVKMKGNDGVAPVITYNGTETLSVYEGAELRLNATAFDAQENCEKPIEYIWTNEKGDVVTAEAGCAPTKGNYTLTLRAVDYFGNVAEKSLAVEVKEADKIPPEISLYTDTVYALTGTLPYLNIAVTDNGGEVEKTVTWSDGALDLAGKLTEGTHTLTVRAQDPSGNVSEKIVTVYVLPTEYEDDVVVDEEVLTPDEPEIPEDSSSDEPVSSDDSSVEDSSSDEPVSRDDSSVEDSSSDEPVSSDDSSVEDSSSDEPVNSDDSSVLEEEKPGKGCGGVICVGLAAVALCGAALLIKKKKE